MPLARALPLEGNPNLAPVQGACIPEEQPLLSQPAAQAAPAASADTNASVHAPNEETAVASAAVTEPTTITGVVTVEPVPHPAPD